MKYLKLLALFAFAATLNHFAPDILAHLHGSSATDAALTQVLWCVSLMLGFGWACNKWALGTVFPSFTLQLLVGIVLHDALSPLSTQVALAVVVCTALAAVILKSGGDEIDRKAFWAIAWPTLLIAVLGYVVTFMVMFALLLWLGLSGPQAAMLSAIIGSTDPAALIPTLKHLVLKPVYQRVLNVAVAESALNDAVGAIFTAVVAELVLTKANVNTVESLAQNLISPYNLFNLGEQFVFGCVAGLVGWWVMQVYERYRQQDHAQKLPLPVFDHALLLFVPLFAFLLAQLLHGNGFLAAFVAGLMGNFNHQRAHFRDALSQSEVHIESLAKPMIFLMVGPFVSLSMLMDTALLGLGVSLLFVFVVRPVAVFASLLVTNITLKEKLFLCVVRETGVIPVVLAVIAVAQFPDMPLLMPLTAWVVIWTLILLPIITPWWAAQLKMLNE